MSKFLSLLLRHRPDNIGLSLDPAGWALVDDLLAGLQHAGWSITLRDLFDLVRHNDKRRFALSPDGISIRSSQGHSIPDSLGLERRAPPEILYHGTAAHLLKSIFQSGLLSGKRQHVHLLTEPKSARTVGRRHGKPVVLQVAAGVMHAAGKSFYCADNEVWLADTVPPEYLRLLSGD